MPYDDGELYLREFADKMDLVRILVLFFNVFFPVKHERMKIDEATTCEFIFHRALEENVYVCLYLCEWDWWECCDFFNFPFSWFLNFKTQFLDFRSSCFCTPISQRMVYGMDSYTGNGEAPSSTCGGREGHG